jgi:hypothetical protein
LIGKHLSLLWLVHHIFFPMAFRVWCMNFYKIVLSQMIMWVVSTSFSRYLSTLFKVMFHPKFHFCYLHVNF